MDRRPVIGISRGDPASIGPEVTIKAVADEAVLAVCKPVVVGDAIVLERAIEFTGVNLSVNRIDDIKQAQFADNTIDVVDLNNVDPDSHRLGEVSAMCGQAAFEYVVKLIGLALDNQIDATVTGPIHKESINLAGHKFGGHTEIYAEYTGTDKYAMLLVEDNLRVIHVSTHVSLRQACDLVKKPRILDAIELIHDACRKIGIEKPKIGVAGLNPQSRDGVRFGDEE